MKKPEDGSLISPFVRPSFGPLLITLFRSVACQVGLLLVEGTRIRTVLSKFWPGCFPSSQTSTSRARQSSLWMALPLVSL